MPHHYESMVVNNFDSAIDDIAGTKIEINNTSQLQIIASLLVVGNLLRLVHYILLLCQL